MSILQLVQHRAAAVPTAGAALALWLASASSPAQQLTLFEPVQTDSPREAPAAALQAAALPGVTAAGFTLRSNSRFGDEYQIVLVDREGNAVNVRWRAGERVALPQHAGYAVVDVNGSALTLQQPPGVPCAADATAGVSCSGPDTAVLSLATLGALQRKPSAADAVMGPQRPPPVDPDAAVVRGADGNPVFVNPFSGPVLGPADLTPEAIQARAAERARGRSQRLQQLQVQRIPEDQVPPGLRVVRTPFGDTLVPIGE